MEQMAKSNCKNPLHDNHTCLDLEIRGGSECEACRAKRLLKVQGKR